MPVRPAPARRPDCRAQERRSATVPGAGASGRDRVLRGAVLALLVAHAQAPLAEAGDAATDASVATPPGGEVLRRPRDREPIKPIEAPEVDAGKAALGRALFLDPLLSKDGTVSCASCHDLANGGDDGRVVSVGIGGSPGTINAPTVFNVALNFKQFWDGRADTLVDQIDGPVQSPIEMGSLWPEVVARLHAHDTYPAAFQAVYPDGINRANVKDALVEFMKSLTTPNSRFDRWLAGDDDALSAVEERGYTLFKLYGCVSCHQGANVGGNMFQVFGVHNDYFGKRGEISDADLGRFNVTGVAADRHSFKVPSLRMAAMTGPTCTTAARRRCAMRSMRCSSFSSDAKPRMRTRTRSSRSSRHSPESTRSCPDDCGRRRRPRRGLSHGGRPIVLREARPPAARSVVPRSPPSRGQAPRERRPDRSSPSRVDRHAGLHGVIACRSSPTVESSARRVRRAGYRARRFRRTSGPGAVRQGAGWRPPDPGTRRTG